MKNESNKSISEALRAVVAQNITPAEEQVTEGMGVDYRESDPLNWGVSALVFGQPVCTEIFRYKDVECIVVRIASNHGIAYCCLNELPEPYSDVIITPTPEQAKAWNEQNVDFLTQFEA